MPAWVEERAKRIAPETKKQYGKKKGLQVAYALGTMQAHAAGKSPKTWKGKPFGTSEGRREAKKKYDEPEKLQKSADADPDQNRPTLADLVPSMLLELQDIQRRQ